MQNPTPVRPSVHMSVPGCPHFAPATVFRSDGFMCAPVDTCAAVPRRSLACTMAVGPARLPVWGSAGRWSCSCADVRAEPRLATTTAQRHVPRCRLRLPRPPRPRRDARALPPAERANGGLEGLPRTHSRPDPRGQSRTASTSACGRPGCVASGVTPVGTAVPSDSDGGDCIRQGLRRGRGWEALDVRSASELMRVRKPPAEEDTRATETGVT